MLNPKPVPNVDVVPCDVEAPKIDCDPKGDELAELKREGEVLAPNGWAAEPNKEGVVDDVEPNGLAVFDAAKGEEPKADPVEVPKPALLKAGVFGANGLEDVDDEKGFADDWPNEGVDEGPKPELPKPTAAVAWPAGAGPPGFWTEDKTFSKILSNKFFLVQDTTNFNPKSTFIS